MWFRAACPLLSDKNYQNEAWVSREEEEGGQRLRDGGGVAEEGPAGELASVVAWFLESQQWLEGHGPVRSPAHNSHWTDATFFVLRSTTSLTLLENALIKKLLKNL